MHINETVSRLKSSSGVWMCNTSFNLKDPILYPLSDQIQILFFNLDSEWRTLHEL